MDNPAVEILFSSQRGLLPEQMTNRATGQGEEQWNNC